jgi:D-alanine-D-alanine ligase
MRICLLTTQDLDSEDLPEHDWPCDPRPFMSEATWELEVLEKETAVQRVIARSREGFDLFFNLCDGAWDEETPGIEVVKTLEQLEQVFTGADSLFYEPSRETMKRVCRAWGIDTPAYVLAATEADVRRAAESLTFPLFVKHPSSYASIGLTRDSRVETPEALLEQARIMIEKYAGALIEEFIDGIECTVLVAEDPDDPENPTTYTPIQYRFPDGDSFKHSDMKWVDYDQMESFPVEDPGLGARLRDVSSRFFLGLNGVGYGRCDMRVDAEGRPFMLEMNASCGVYHEPEEAGSADYCLLNDPAGHEGFTRQIVRAAFAGQKRRSRGWVGHPRSDGEYGIYASRSFAPGDRIVRFEAEPHHLVTRAHVAANWNGPRLEWLRRCAWPLTDELWVVWGRDAKDWKPLNHSCEPSAWLEGLDVVARRPLAPGDEVTMDYATFYNEQMPSFECDCNAAECRGTIRGEDYLEDFVERYGDHVSDYVRSRRARLPNRAGRGLDDLGVRLD